ncbi:hypothetical protein NUW54_g7169 [Trametes sanguinea]|uniref:Uncharacterized protein n=1 Tax=Trametes sanguinea TaxID=158606 RepID=A0ACC1PP53_9APHY|nr:hypothetical protein NUW54_g7169 [Trametes sanguinea]
MGASRRKFLYYRQEATERPGPAASSSFTLDDVWAGARGIPTSETVGDAADDPRFTRLCLARGRDGHALAEQQPQLDALDALAIALAQLVAYHGKEQPPGEQQLGTCQPPVTVAWIVPVCARAFRAALGIDASPSPASSHLERRVRATPLCGRPQPLGRQEKLEGPRVDAAAPGADAQFVVTAAASAIVQPGEAVVGAAQVGL